MTADAVIVDSLMNVHLELGAVMLANADCLSSISAASPFSFCADRYH